MLLFSKKKNGQSVDRWHFPYICIMKRGFLFVCLWLYSFNFWGREVIGTYWKPIDNTFDSIADVLELEFISTDSIYYRDSLIQELYTIARAHHKETVYLWRAKFWDARSQLKKNNSDSTIHLIDEAYQQVDSIRYVYDYMRVFHLWTIMHKNQPHVAYKNLKKISEYYARTNNLFMLAHAYIDMGNILSRLKDYPKALEYLQKADSYYKKLNKPVYRAKNQLNISNVLYSMNEEVQAEKILYKLLENPVCVEDTSFYINTLLLLTEHDVPLSKKYVSEAYRLSTEFANKRLLIQSECFMGRFYQNNHRQDSALYYYRKACRRVNIRNIDLIVPVIKNMSECFAAIQQEDSAYVYLNRYEQYKDSLDQVNSLAEIRRMESRAAIEKQELELQQAEERGRFRFVLILVVCAFILCIAALVCYIFWKKSREEKIKKQLKELENKELVTRLENEMLQNNCFKVELEYKDRELASNSLIIMEKNQVLKSLVDELEKEKDAGNIQSNTALQISNNIRMHLGTDDEWDFFKMQFVKVHPDFFVRLKTLCPSITEGELRLCAYIRTGMENKHIAQMLSLQPESVKKNRYRLRQKLNLGKESLEDFLRGI